MAQLIAADMIHLIVNFGKDGKLVMRSKLARKEVMTKLDDGSKDKCSVFCFKFDEHWNGIGLRQPRKCGIKAASKKKTNNKKQSTTAKNANAKSKLSKGKGNH